MQFIIVISMQVESRTINNNYYLVDHLNEKQTKQKKMYEKQHQTFTAYCIITTTFGYVSFFLLLVENEILHTWTQHEIIQKLRFFPYFFFWSLRMYIFSYDLNEIKPKQQTGERTKKKKIIN